MYLIIIIKIYFIFLKVQLSLLLYYKCPMITLNVVNVKKLL